MPSPVTSVLDNFNRSDGALGSNWPGKIDDTAVDVPQIASNVIRAGAGYAYSDSYWVTQFGTDQEAFFTWSTIGSEFDLFVKCQSPGTGSGKAYLFYGSSGDGNGHYYKLTNGHTYTELASVAWNTALANGHKVWLKATESGGNVTLQAYQDAGSGYVALGSGYTDSSSPITGNGYIGIGLRDNPSFADDFGGGDAVVAAGQPFALRNGLFVPHAPTRIGKLGM